MTLLDTVELATYCVRTFSLFKVRSTRISRGSYGHSRTLTSLSNPTCVFRTAPARRGRWGSSSSRPGQTTGCPSTPPPSWPSSGGWNRAILQTQGPWWYTAGEKQRGRMENILKHEIDFALSICCNEYMNTYDKTQCTHGYLEVCVWVIFAGIMGALNKQNRERLSRRAISNLNVPSKIVTKKKKKVTLPSADTHHFPHADLSWFPATHQQPTSWLGLSPR